jgi:hypothetical protein
MRRSGEANNKALLKSPGLEVPEQQADQQNAVNRGFARVMVVFVEESLPIIMTALVA